MTKEEFHILWTSTFPGTILIPHLFTQLENINLIEVDDEKYDEFDIYRPAFSETV